MILDHYYNKTKRSFCISYINSKGLKELLDINVNKFKSYYSTPDGKFENWDGSRCGEKYVGKPGIFELKTFINELGEPYKSLLFGKTNPLLYTFDIETEISDEFPEPSQAKFPITTISIANPKCDVMILGTKPIGDSEYLSKNFEDYMNNCQFFQSLNLPMPKIQYVYFETEERMLKWFLENIVAKVPVLAGWNSILFDWQYIQNRISGYYPDLSLSLCSLDRTMSSKNYRDLRDNVIRLSMPNHTLVLDMMDIIDEFDLVVMPIKESLSLDYIATESVGVGKIKYDGDLQKLFEEDYPKYVFYNAIDSILVQLIDKRFKTLQNLYTQSLICRDRISTAFSKIAITESLFFNYFFDKGIKVVPQQYEDRERGILVGAYVRQPTPGKHNFVTCNDFAALYPSTIMTLNISIENFLGCIEDGTFTEDDLEKYRNDPNYFVSVNGSVYKNDKDYAFREIQMFLRTKRSYAKYLSKKLDATVMLDVEHIMHNRKHSHDDYPEDVIKGLKDINYDIKNANDILKLQDIETFKKELKDEITYLSSAEQAYKLCANSCYGGCSHIAFEWFNIYLANDITGEARNLIHMMERHIPQWFEENWKNATELHKKLGITLKEKL